MKNNTSNNSVRPAVLNMLNARTMRYIPRLNKLIPGNEDYALLVAELEYRFGQQPNGFFMFLGPAPDHPDYSLGWSWAEIFYQPEPTIKLSLDAVCATYGSLREFDESKDKFKNKYYCSVYERSGNRYFYLRNPIVDEAIRSLLHGVSVPEIYEFHEKLNEKRKTQILSDLQVGRFGDDPHSVNLLKVLAALDGPVSENEFEEVMGVKK